MRFVKLTKNQEVRIRDLYRNSQKNNVRERAQALLLSNEGYKRKEIATVLKKRKDTITDWFNKIESDPNWNLEDEQRSGRKPKLDKSKKESLFFCSRKSMS